MYEILEKKKNILEGDFYGQIYSSVFLALDDMLSDSIVNHHSEINISDEIIMLFMSSVWDNNLNTGIGNIDSQHKEIFDLIVQLVNSMKENKSKDEILNILNELQKYAIRHFKEEEAIQEKYKYPKYMFQVKEHEKFKNELDELRIAINEKTISPLFTINVYQKMFKWYRKHILNLDKDFGEFLLNIVR